MAEDTLFAPITNRFDRMEVSGAFGDLGTTRLLLSPDGKWAVAAGTAWYEVCGIRASGAEDLPQSRLPLINLADQKSKPEVLILPGGVLLSAALSPDGKAVAIGSMGGVHLIGVSAGEKK